MTSETTFEGRCPPFELLKRLTRRTDLLYFDLETTSLLPAQTANGPPATPV